MLVTTSNWAVSDGSLAAAGGGRAAAWLEVIRRAIVRAGCRQDGRYRPIAEATIIFAGDTFDWLLSAAWSGPHKPWHAGREAERLRARVAMETLRAARSAARTLLRWGRGGIAVPAADARGRPSDWGVTRAMARIVLLAGDRDRWLTGFAPIARLGLHVGEEWSDGQLHVRHGHDLDPLAHLAGPAPITGERTPTLGESLVVDLLVPFAMAAREDPVLWPMVRPVLGSLATARPTTMPARLDASIRAAIGASAGRGIRLRLEASWRDHVARWHRIARRDAIACEAEFDALDPLAAWLERLGPKGDCPAAVARLDPPLAWSGCGMLVAHATSPTGPSVACRLAGRSWSEPLEPPPPGRGIVTIGVGDGDGGGGGCVDAA